MFSFIRGKKNKEESVEVKSVVVVFNTVNHSSLLAAVLYATVLEERTDLTIDLVDVRAVIPENADRYVWFEAGTVAEYRDYYAKPNGSEIKMFEEIEKRSIYVLENQRQDMLPEDTVIGQAFLALEEDEVISGDEKVLFWKYAMMSLGWLKYNSPAEEIVPYNEALHWCYHRYCGKPITIEDFKRLSDASGEKIQAYIHEQRYVSRTVAQRCKSSYVDGKFVYYLTTTGPEVYGIIRRIAIVKKDFLHCSMGTNGMVVYASAVFDPAKIFGNGILNLIPKIAT